MPDHLFVPGPKRVKVRKPRQIYRVIRPDRQTNSVDISKMDFMEQLIALGLTGKNTKISSKLFNEHVSKLSLCHRDALMGIPGKYLNHALDKEKILQAAIEVFGVNTNGATVCIDPELTTIALQEAIEVLFEHAVKGAKIIFASSRPSSTLELFSQLAKLATSLGAEIIDCDNNTTSFMIDGRRDRCYTWFSNVAVTSDGSSLLATDDTKAADDLFFYLPRPDLVVADHAFAAQALTSGYPTIAFVSLDSLAVGVASINEQSCLSVPISLSEPSSHYTIIANQAKLVSTSI